MRTHNAVFSYKKAMASIPGLATMKMYINLGDLPSQPTLDGLHQSAIDFTNEVRDIAVSLSMEERKNRRKLGPRRTAYAQQAERVGRQYERVMPRHFEPAEFGKLMAFRNQIAEIHARVSEAMELLDDTLMASGIDAMTFTKLVHDGIRAANAYDAAADTALKELDEFNARAANEDSDESPASTDKSASSTDKVASGTDKAAG